MEGSGGGFAVAGSDVLFHKRLDVGKDLLAVELEEELVAGGGVEFDGDMPDAGVAQALGGPFDPFAAAAHRVVRAVGDPARRFAALIW